MTGLRQAARYRHDSVDIYIGILGRKKKTLKKMLLVTSWLILSSVQLDFIVDNILHKILCQHTQICINNAISFSIKLFKIYIYILDDKKRIYFSFYAMACVFSLL